MDGKKYFLFNIKNVANQHGQARGFPLISRKEIYDEPNFNYKDKFFVYWYKYCRRGMQVEVVDDVKFDIEFLANMVNECLKALNDDKNLKTGRK